MIVQSPGASFNLRRQSGINDRNNLFQCLGYDGTDGKHWGAHPLQPREIVSHLTATIR
jgi:hypothetical protein